VKLEQREGRKEREERIMGEIISGTKGGKQERDKPVNNFSHTSDLHVFTSTFTATRDKHCGTITSAHIQSTWLRTEYCHYKRKIELSEKQCNEKKIS
jgi:hypothetical protein